MIVRQSSKRNCCWLIIYKENFFKDVTLFFIWNSLLFNDCIFIIHLWYENIFTNTFRFRFYIFVTCCFFRSYRASLTALSNSGRLSALNVLKPSSKLTNVVLNILALDPSPKNVRLTMLAWHGISKIYKTKSKNVR